MRRLLSVLLVLALGVAHVAVPACPMGAGPLSAGEAPAESVGPGAAHHADGTDPAGGERAAGGEGQHATGDRADREHHEDGERCLMPVGCGAAGVTIAGFASLWAPGSAVRMAASLPTPPAPVPPSLESPPPRRG
jgi:hypothetical protein